MRWRGTYLELLRVLFEILLRQELIFLLVVVVAGVVLLSCLLEHQPLHRTDLSLKFGLLLFHEFGDLVEDLPVSLGQLKNVSDVELVHHGSAPRLLLLEGVEAFAIVARIMLVVQ